MFKIDVNMWYFVQLPNRLKRGLKGSDENLRQDILHVFKN